MCLAINQQRKRADKQRTGQDGDADREGPLEREALVVAEIHARKPHEQVGRGHERRQQVNGLPHQRGTRHLHGIRAEVVNAGIGDTTTRDGVLRFDRDVRSHAPHLVIIQFGINDSWINADLGRTEPRLARAEFRNNLRYFIRTLRADGATTILMTPNPMRWSDPFYIELFTSKPGLLDTTQVRGINALLDRYSQDVRDIAVEQDTPLVDVLAAFEDYGEQPGRSIDDLLLAGDGMHPNDAGQRLVCDLLTPGVAAALARMARP